MSDGTNEHPPENDTPLLNEKAHILPEGTRVRVTERSVSGDRDVDPTAGRPGDEYDVWSYAGPGEGDDPNGKPYYLLDDAHTTGGSHWAYPEHVETVRTVEQQAARKPPTADAIRKGVAGALMSMDDPIEVNEADYSGESEVMVYGQTDDGLRVGFRVRIDHIEEVDW